MREKDLMFVFTSSFVLGGRLHLTYLVLLQVVPSIGLSLLFTTETI